MQSREKLYTVEDIIELGVVDCLLCKETEDKPAIILTYISSGIYCSCGCPFTNSCITRRSFDPEKETWMEPDCITEELRLLLLL